MNVKWLIESGEYRKEDLPNDKRMYIDGMENMLEYIDKFKADVLIPDDNEKLSILERISRECTDETLSELKEYLKISIWETLVSLIDAEEKKGGGQSNNGKE